MSRLLTLGLVLALMLAAIAAAAASNRHDARPGHSCYAPCSVLIGNKQEDEFGLDFGWRDKRHAVVDIYTSGPGCIPARDGDCSAR